jgi:hypothetical protein
MRLIARNGKTLIDEQYSLVAVSYQRRFPLRPEAGSSTPRDQDRGH